MDLQQKSNKPKSVIDEIDAGTIGVQVTGSGADHQSTPAVGISAALVEPNILGEPSALNDLVKLLLLKEGREARKAVLEYPLDFVPALGEMRSILTSLDKEGDEPNSTAIIRVLGFKSLKEIEDDKSWQETAAYQLGYGPGRRRP